MISGNKTFGTSLVFVNALILTLLRSLQSLLSGHWEQVKVCKTIHLRQLFELFMILIIWSSVSNWTLVEQQFAVVILMAQLQLSLCCRYLKTYICYGASEFLQHIIPCSSAAVCVLCNTAQMIKLEIYLYKDKLCNISSMISYSGTCCKVVAIYRCRSANLKEVTFILSNKTFDLIDFISRSNCVSFPLERLLFLKPKTVTLRFEWEHKIPLTQYDSNKWLFCIFETILMFSLPHKGL